MSSLWKRSKSKYWIGCFTAADGRQLKRSTRTSDKRKAQVIVAAWEQAESLGARGLLTSRQQLKIVLEQTLERLTGEKPESVTVGVWLERWLKAERGAVAQSTLHKYNGLLTDFLAFLGTRSHVPIEAITTEDFLRYRDHLLAEGRAPRTVNVTVRKILRMPFQAAVNQGYLARNPIAAIRHLRDTKVEKGTFTPEQVCRLLEAAQGDWKGLVLAGFYTGARMTDLSRLVWGNVDLAERSICFRQRKTEHRTGALLKVPIHPELEDYLLSRSVPDSGQKPLFPELFGKRGTGKSGLSSAFKRIMEKAGIDAGIARERKGKAGRSVSLLSFHSLRHSFTSALANAGVPAELRQKLTGHADAKSHGIYTHHEFETLRASLERVARLPRAGGSQ